MWPRNATNTDCRPTHGTVRKRHTQIVSLYLFLFLSLSLSLSLSVDDWIRRTIPQNKTQQILNYTRYSHWYMYTSIWWYLRVLPDYRIRSFLSIQYVHGDLCKHLGIDSSSVLESIPKCLHKSPCECRILKNDLIL